MNHNNHIQTKAIHSGQSENNDLNDVIQPIHLSTIFEREKDGSLYKHNYTRISNPNRLAVETKLAAIEGAKTAIAFSSGMAAINALLENILEPDTHILIPDNCYHGTKNLVSKFFKRWKVSFTEVDMTKIENIANNLKENTRLIWIETPSNPQLKITDIEAVVALAQKNNIVTVTDNTFATPLIQRTLDMNVDYTMYSSTKSFSGHSDILGGVVLTNHDNESSNNIRAYQQDAGAVPSPFDCWLLNRSLATFPLRFEKQCSNAFAIAEYLQTFSQIEKVYYPGLVTHDNHDIAKKQMKNGFGSIVSILIKGDSTAVFNFTSRLKLFKHATSLGGVESLVEHRRSVEGENPISPDNLLRISVGIEHVEDLKNDIMQSFG
jgi:cystathionine gamma-synthase